MPRITNKAFDVLLTTLVKLSNGAHKYVSHSKITAILDEKELREMRSKLEMLRLDYIQKEKLAREAYEQFQIEFKTAQKKVSNDSRIIKGILGPKSEELLDFGILPERSKARKKLPLIEELRIKMPAVSK